jgi:CDP-2,3-bis-(O-geranylgeranyl)-sn-glycerol synthase
MTLARAVSLVYFMAPAYLANACPPMVRYWRGWNRPISQRWLGSHKTVVGFAAGVAGALATSLVQHVLALEIGPSLHQHWVALGLRFGVGAMGGDAVKSFFKRRRGIAPGRPWLPFDQLDFVIGALILTAPALTAIDVAVVLAVTFLGHVAVNHAAFALGLRDVKW